MGRLALQLKKATVSKNENSSESLISCYNGLATQQQSALDHAQFPLTVSSVLGALTLALTGHSWLASEAIGMTVGYNDLLSA